MWRIISTRRWHMLCAISRTFSLSRCATSTPRTLYIPLFAI
jgi:hypothetical protein